MAGTFEPRPFIKLTELPDKAQAEAAYIAKLGGKGRYGPKSKAAFESAFQTEYDRALKQRQIDVAQNEAIGRWNKEARESFDRGEGLRVHEEADAANKAAEARQKEAEAKAAEVKTQKVLRKEEDRKKYLEVPWQNALDAYGPPVGMAGGIAAGYGTASGIRAAEQYIGGLNNLRRGSLANRADAIDYATPKGYYDAKAVARSAKMPGIIPSEMAASPALRGFARFLPYGIAAGALGTEGLYERSLPDENTSPGQDVGYYTFGNAAIGAAGGSLYKGAKAAQNPASAPDAAAIQRILTAVEYAKDPKAWQKATALPSRYPSGATALPIDRERAVDLTPEPITAEQIAREAIASTPPDDLAIQRALRAAESQKLQEEYARKKQAFAADDGNIPAEPAKALLEPRRAAIAPEPTPEPVPTKRQPRAIPAASAQPQGVTAAPSPEPVETSSAPLERPHPKLQQPGESDAGYLLRSGAFQKVDPNVHPNRLFELARQANRMVADRLTEAGEPLSISQSDIDAAARESRGAPSPAEPRLASPSASPRRTSWKNAAAMETGDLDRMLVGEGLSTEGSRAQKLATLQKLGKISLGPLAIGAATLLSEGNEVNAAPQGREESTPHFLARRAFPYARTGLDVTAPELDPGMYRTMGELGTEAGRAVSSSSQPPLGLTPKRKVNSDVPPLPPEIAESAIGSQMRAQHDRSVQNLATARAEDLRQRQEAENIKSGGSGDILRPLPQSSLDEALSGYAKGGEVKPSHKLVPAGHDPFTKHPHVEAMNKALSVVQTGLEADLQKHSKRLETLKKAAGRNASPAAKKALEKAKDDHDNAIADIWSVHHLAKGMNNGKIVPKLGMTRAGIIAMAREHAQR